MHARNSLGARPSKNRKGRSDTSAVVEVYTAALWNVGNFIKLLNFTKPVEFSAEPDTHTSVLSSPLGVHSIIKRSKT